MKEFDTVKEIPPREAKVEELKNEAKLDTPKLELKVLPSHLKYVFLEEDDNKPIFISKSLYAQYEKKMIKVLKENKEAIV